MELTHYDTANSIVSPKPEWIGRWAIRNSAGLILFYEGDPTFPTKRQASKQARIEGGRGWMGDCWPVYLSA